MQHPYLLADRFEDLTAEESVRQDPLCDRRIALFGYLRGCNLKPGMHVHLAGVGDFALADVSALPDPCPLPGAIKRRSLDDRERLLYAPMSDVGRLTYDKDAMYVNLADHTVNFTRPEADADEPGAPVPYIDTPGVQMVRELQGASATLDEKLRQSNIKLFRQSRGREATDDGGDDAEASSDESDEEEWSDDDEDAVMAEAPAAAGGDARTRRRAVFDSDSSSSEEDDAYDDDAEEEDDAEGLGGASRWKEGLAQQVARLHTKQDLMVRCFGPLPAWLPARLTLGLPQAAVYGTQSAHGPGGLDDRDDDAEDEDEGELFRPKAMSAQAAELDVPDSSKRVLAGGGAEWTDADTVATIRNRFVTGDWDEAAQRTAAGGDDGGGEDDDLYGDFEDVEALPDAAPADAEELRLRKAALKAQFDAEHDMGRDGQGDGDAKAEPAQRKGAPPAEEAQETFYDMRKREMAEEQARTRLELSKLHPSVREALEGHNPGAYMRIVLEQVPCELVQHFDPAVPLLLGGLLPTEQSMVFLQARLRPALAARRCVSRLRPAGSREEASLACQDAQDARPAGVFARLAPLPVRAGVRAGGRGRAAAHAQVHPRPHALPRRVLRAAGGAQHQLRRVPDAQLRGCFVPCGSHRRGARV